MGRTCTHYSLGLTMIKCLEEFGSRAFFRFVRQTYLWPLLAKRLRPEGKKDLIIRARVRSFGVRMFSTYRGKIFHQEVTLDQDHSY